MRCLGTVADGGGDARGARTGEAFLVADVDAAHVDPRREQLAADAVADRPEAAHDGVAPQSAREASEREREPRGDDGVGQKGDHERERGDAEHQDSDVVEPQPVRSIGLQHVAAEHGDDAAVQCIHQREVLGQCVDRGRRCHEREQQCAQEAQAAVGAQHPGDAGDLPPARPPRSRGRAGARLSDHAGRLAELAGQQAAGRVEREQSGAGSAGQHAQLVVADVNALRVVVAQGRLDEGGRRQLRGRERATREQPLGLLPQLQVEQPHDEAQLGLELPRRQSEVEVDDVALVAEHERLRAALRQARFELGHVHVAQLDDLHVQQPELLGGANGQPFGAVDEDGVRPSPSFRRPARASTGRCA